MACSAASVPRRGGSLAVLTPSLHVAAQHGSPPCVALCDWRCAPERDLRVAAPTTVQAPSSEASGAREACGVQVAAASCLRWAVLGGRLRCAALEPEPQPASCAMTQPRRVVCAVRSRGLKRRTNTHAATPEAAARRIFAAPWTTAEYRRVESTAQAKAQRHASMGAGAESVVVSYYVRRESTTANGVQAAPPGMAGTP